eukprot:6039702-Heterocapsa_arctica.AAC.1
MAGDYKEMHEAGDLDAFYLGMGLAVMLIIWTHMPEPGRAHPQARPGTPPRSAAGSTPPRSPRLVMGADVSDAESTEE